MRAMFSMVALLVLSASLMAQEQPRTITVSGSGSASVIPDRASVNMSIVAISPTVAEAQAEAATVTARILAMTDKLGIDRSRIDTTGSSVRPNYRWNTQREEQELRGYVAERQMLVDVRDLEKLGGLIEGAVEAGVNQVSPPQLDSSKRRDAYREALDAAARDARANAAQLANSLGARLGDVLQITTESQYAQPMPYMRAQAAQTMDAGAAETYNASNLSFDATISVVFELEKQ